MDDRWLYVSCWGTGELKQYDVSDIFHPRETGSVRLGGIVRRQPHPAAPDLRLGGGPQMVEVSRDGRRVYVTNSIYGAWDPIFYPEGVGAWAAKLDADPQVGGLAAGPAVLPQRGRLPRAAGAPDPAPGRGCLQRLLLLHELIDMRPLAHHLGEDSLVNLLLVGGAGLSLMVVQGRARLAAARARLTRRVRGPEQRPHDGRR